MQIKKNRSIGEWLWSPYFVVGVIVAILVVARLPYWRPFGVFPVPPYHFTILVQVTALNAFAFLVGYCLLKPFKTLVFWKFAIYIIVLMGVSLLVRKWGPWDTESWLGDLVSEYYWFFFQLLPLIFSILLNIGFLKYLFKIDTRSAILMGILIGMTGAESFRLGQPVYAG